MKNENIKTQEVKESIDTEDYKIDFLTSSAVSRITIKILAIYVPIIWASGIPVAMAWYGIAYHVPNETIRLFLIPLMLFASYFIFIAGCLFFSKLFLILINLIHKPKEGIFKAEKGDPDFEFWCLRKELKKFVLWVIRNCPLPWIDTWALRWFGTRIDFSSHLYDAWFDMEFVKFGRKVTIGQGAVVMSSMVIGKYLIIKRLFFDDYAVIGGMSVISPGTVIGKDTILGAISNTHINQILEDGWIYMGIPGRKFK
ncbi:MAG: hypothetical protein ACFFAO_17810, partial [Candidatus Hermodarchaeota archaeon]